MMQNSTISHTSVYVNAAFSTLVMLLAIPGNFAMIIIYIRGDKALRDFNNTAITFLSCSDFVRACVVMPLKIFHQLSFATTLAEPTCTISALICGFTFVFSPMTLALIGVVRYFKVVPSTYRKFELTKTKFYRTVAAVFVIATSFAFLPVIGITGTYSYSPSHGVCFTNWSPKNEIFRTFFYIIVIGLAFPTLSVCYFLLFRALRNHHNNLKEKTGISRVQHPAAGSSCGSRDIELQDGDAVCNATPKDDEGVSPKGVAVIVNISCDDGKDAMRSTEIEKETPSSSSRTGGYSKKYLTPLRERFSTDMSKTSVVSNERFCKNISQQERQVTRLMMIIFVAYCLCWIPAAIVNAMALYHKHNTHKKIPLVYFYVIVTMVEVKCALNPLIYGLGNRRYRNVLKGIFKKRNLRAGGSRSG